MHALLLTLLLAIAPTTQPATTHVRVVDQNGAPLRDATVRVEGFKESAAPTTTTMELGDSNETNLTVDRPTSITVYAPGHIPAHSWCNPDDPSSAARQPASIEFRLEPGTKVGGKIVNEQGKPVAGALVHIYLQMLAMNPGSATKPANWFWDIPLTTDADGRWTSDMAPATWKSAFVRPTQQDYAQSAWLQPQDAQELRNSTAIGTLAVGRAVSGIVRDADGRAVEGAIVQAGRSIGDTTPSAITKPDGAFTFGHIEDGSALVLVRAAGLAPQIVNLSSGPVAGLDVKLLEPRKLHGTVVDQAGQPVAHACVAFCGWGDRQIYLRDWMYYTDESGHFAFDVPPGESISICSTSGGNGSIPATTIAPDQNDVRFVFERSTTVTGRVVDATTRQPIKSFKVYEATDDEEYSKDWSNPRRFSEGEFQLTLPAVGAHTHRLRIEADGHLPAISDVLVAHDGECTYDVGMKPAANLKGIVLGTDGKPLADARIVPVFARMFLGDPGDLLAQCAQAEGANTDNTGTFSLPPLDEPFTFIVAHKSGFADVSDKDFGKSTQIKLTAWARIEGKTNEPNTGLSAGEQQLSTGNIAAINSPYVRADASGHYSFPRIVPGKVSVTRSVVRQGERKIGFQTRTIEVVAGQTAVLNFDIGNHTLRGSIELPADIYPTMQFTR